MILHLVRKIPTFDVIRKFTTAFTKVTTYTYLVPYESRLQPNNAVCVRYILISPSTLRRNLSSGFFYLGYPTKMLCTFFITTCRVTRTKLISRTVS